MRLLPPLTPPQRNRAELLDQKCGSSREVEKSLRDIARINKYLGGSRVVENALWPLLQDRKEATILDIGTGSADIPRALVKAGRKRGVKLTIFAADLLERHLQIARRDCEGFPTIFPLGADAFSLPLRDKSVDVVTASLFLHHFRPPQIISLLREFERVSRLGFIANDQIRDLVPLAFFRLSAPIFARSYLTRYDGAASILRAYTAPEMREIVGSSGVAATVSEHFPYRLSVVGHKNRFSQTLMPKLGCKCGNIIKLNSIPNPNESLLLSDEEMDTLYQETSTSEIIDRINALSKSLYKCAKCGRLIIFWKNGENLGTSYVPEE